MGRLAVRLRSGSLLHVGHHGAGSAAARAAAASSGASAVRVVSLMAIAHAVAHQAANREEHERQHDERDDHRRRRELQTKHSASFLGTSGHRPEGVPSGPKPLRLRDAALGFKLARDLVLLLVEGGHGAENLEQHAGQDHDGHDRPHVEADLAGKQAAELDRKSVV